MNEPSNLDLISTRWSQITDPDQFVLRYASAIQAYLRALLPADSAEDAAQDFLAAGLTRGFLRTPELRGRFREYLKTAVRNTALTRLRRSSPRASGPPSPGRPPTCWSRCPMSR